MSKNHVAPIRNTTIILDDEMIEYLAYFNLNGNARFIW